MNELQKDFLNQSIKDLKEIAEKLKNKNVSENVLRDAFRTLHTIKGTAQVFGCVGIGRFAHEIENLLQAGRDKKISPDESFDALLREGFGYLIDSFRQKQTSEETGFPQVFVEKLRLIAKSNEPVKDFSFHLPQEILAQLSASEKNSIEAAIENGKNLFLIEAGFRAEDLESEFKSFKKGLDDAGAVAAVFPSFKPAFKASQKIGFRVFFVTEKSSAEVSQIVLPFVGEIDFKIEKDQNIFGNSPGTILTQAVVGAKILAEKSGKEIEFDALLGEAEIPVRHLKILFDALLHLTRNAIDHGIERKGRIMIRLVSEKNGSRLTVSDNGRGIGIENLRAKAIEKKLISADALLSKGEILNLIFAHGFSTGETISVTSGRGVGLDAVKDSVERAGGKINVKTEKKAGTSFEIFLPNEE